MEILEIELLGDVKNNFEELLKKYRCNPHQLIGYLISMESSKCAKGTQMIEQKLKQFFHFDYPQEITPHLLRMSSVMNGKTVGLASVKTVVELYQEEIIAYNNFLIPLQNRFNF